MSELCMSASAHRTAALFQRFNLRSLQDGSGVSPGNTTGESLVQVNSLDEGVCEAERLHECFQVWPIDERNGTKTRSSTFTMKCC